MIEIKDYPHLGMNAKSDKLILPEHYEYVECPHYICDGHHSVKQLEEMCKQYAEYCHQQSIIKFKLIRVIKSL